MNTRKNATRVVILRPDGSVCSVRSVCDVEPAASTVLSRWLSNCCSSAFCPVAHTALPTHLPARCDDRDAVVPCMSCAIAMPAVRWQLQLALVTSCLPCTCEAFEPGYEADQLAIKRRPSHTIERR